MRTVAVGLLSTVCTVFMADAGDPTQPLPSNANKGKAQFDAMAAVTGNTTDGMAAAMQGNPLFFPTLTDFWCAWELTDRKRKPALLIDDMQVEYAPYVQGILPQTKILIAAFRKAGLPIFWSAWWRFGPDDGFFNSMDRFYGPTGYRTAGNALYNHNSEHGGEILPEIGPITDEEKRRVMHKSYSLDMFDERPMEWLVPSGQGTLHDELQSLGVDTVVQVGAWTDDCIISTAFHAFSLQYDVVLVEDGVSTASKQHFNAVEVMRGAAAKVLLADQVADYINTGLLVVPPVVPKTKSAGARASVASFTNTQSNVALSARSGSAPRSNDAEGVNWISPVAQLFNTGLIVVFGPFCFVAGWLTRGHTGVIRGMPGAAGTLLD